jgi:hypothetical protein
VKRLSSTLSAVILALAASSAGVPPPAFAQPAPADARQAARELADKGYEHYEAGEYAKAIKFFRDAEARFHAPTLLLMQGNAQVKNGGLVEARAVYQRVVDEQLASDAPKEFVDAQVEAKAAIESLKLRIATLKIVLKGMTADKVHITIDDVEVPTASVLQPLPQNPGTHKIVGVIGGEEGGRAVYQSVTLKEGSTKQIQLVFRPGGPATSGPPPSRGCASCEIEGLRAGAGAPAGLLSTAFVGVLMALRRRGRRRLPGA